MDAIEKEKLKQQHLKVVINHLESEVSNLAQETVSQMENSMTQVREDSVVCCLSVHVCAVYWGEEEFVRFSLNFDCRFGCSLPSLSTLAEK